MPLPKSLKKCRSSGHGYAAGGGGGGTPCLRKNGVKQRDEVKISCAPHGCRCSSNGSDLRQPNFATLK